MATAREIPSLDLLLGLSGDAVAVGLVSWDDGGDRSSSASTTSLR